MHTPKDPFTPRNGNDAAGVHSLCSVGFGLCPVFALSLAYFIWAHHFMRDCSRIPDAAVTRFVSDRAPGERVLNTKMRPCGCVYVRSRKQVSVAAGRCHSSFGNRLKFAKHRRSTIWFRLIINTSMSCRGKRPKRVLSGPFSVTLRRTPAGCVLWYKLCNGKGVARWGKGEIAELVAQKRNRPIEARANGKQ